MYHFSNYKVKRLISFVLSAVILLLSTCGCTKTNDAMAPFKNNNVSMGIENANTEYFVGYKHYDPTDFYSKCDELYALILSENADTEKAWSIYDELYGDALLVMDYYNSAMVGLDENNQNKYFEEEQNYTSSIKVEMLDRIKTIGNIIANGTYAESFRKHLDNDDLFNCYKKYKALSEEAKKLLDEENNLKAEYTSVNNEVTKGIEENTLTYKDANKKLGEVFLNLVSVRKKIAKEMGYDNYADYADKEIFLRDYTENDLKTLKQEIKKFGNDIDYFTYYGFPDTEMDGIDTDTIICDVGETLSKFSKIADDSYTYLTNNGLLSSGFESTRSDSAYTISIFSTDSSVICQKEYPSMQLYNYLTLSHELGHFSNARLVSNPIPIFSEDGCIDVMELHSSFLETLFSLKVDDIFTVPEYYKGYELTSLTGVILSGCYYDDWQREIYKSDHDLTLDEINSLFKEICLEYGVGEYEGMEYDWIWTQHNFKLPMYYISYATTAFAALEVWDIAQDDFDYAVSIWENVLTQNAYTKGYMNAINNIGLVPFTDSNEVNAVINNVIEYMCYAEELVYFEDYEDIDEETLSDTDYYEESEAA